MESFKQDLLAYREAVQKIKSAILQNRYQVAVNANAEIRQLPTGELNESKISAFCRVGFTHHMEILAKCKAIEERWYYIMRCADEFWSYA